MMDSDVDEVLISSRKLCPHTRLGARARRKHVSVRRKTDMSVRRCQNVSLRCCDAIRL